MSKDNNNEERNSSLENLMEQDVNQVPIYTRREIEALMAGEIIEAFNQEIGKEKTLQVMGNVFQSMAKKAGERMKEYLGDNSLEKVPETLQYFAKGGALELAEPEKTSTGIIIRVTRCRYVEMYQKYGLEEYGHILSCKRDFAFWEGFNPQIKFTRTQTIMDGADHCDFCFSLE